MYPQFRTLLLATSIALAMVPISAAADSVTQDVIEARQETQIWTTYALNPYLRANDLKVSVDNGKATLTGNVEAGINKDLAQQIALGVSGVKEVDNRIVVQADYIAPAPSAERSYGEVIDDATITTAILSKLLWSRYTDGLAMTVETKSGKVTLQGTADSGAARDLAGRLAMNTHGVVSVHNKLVLRTAKPGVAASVKRSAQAAGHDMADGWITTKVKSTFLYSTNVDGSDIDVSTRSGVVTLRGKIASGSERALAIELARNVRGVRSVNSKGLTL